MSQPLRLRPPRFTDDFIIRKAESLGTKLVQLQSFPLPLLSISFDAAYDHVIYPDYGIVLVETEDLGIDETGAKVLGRYDPFDNIAFVDRSLQHDPRRTFTCWHEVGGHGVLQGEWLRSELRRLRLRGCVRTSESDLDFASTSILERQANLFASFAGAPTSVLHYALDELLNISRPIRYVGPGSYTLVFHGMWHWFTVDSLNDLCRILAKQIQWRFGNLSVEALSYRIETSRFVFDATRRFHLRRTAAPTVVTRSHDFSSLLIK